MADPIDEVMVDIDDEILKQKLVVEYLSYLQLDLGLTLSEVVQPVVDSVLEPRKPPGYLSGTPWDPVAGAGCQKLAWLLLVDALRQLEGLGSLRVVQGEKYYPRCMGRY